MLLALEESLEYSLTDRTNLLLVGTIMKACISMKVRQITNRYNYHVSVYQFLPVQLFYIVFSDNQLSGVNFLQHFNNGLHCHLQVCLLQVPVDRIILSQSGQVICCWASCNLVHMGQVLNTLVSCNLDTAQPHWDSILQETVEIQTTCGRIINRDIELPTE